MATLAERVLQRVAKKFTSPEQLKEYLRLHPDADKAKHSVKKQDGTSGKQDQPGKPPPIPEEAKKEKSGPPPIPDEAKKKKITPPVPESARKKSEPPKDKNDHDEGHEPEGAKPGRMEAWRDRLKGLSESAVSFARSAPKAVKSFMGDPEFRKNTIGEAKKHLSLASVGKRLAETVKHEIKEYKTAAAGVKKVLSGGKMSKHERHAFTTVATHLAIGGAAAAFAATGPLAGAAIFAKGLARQIALKSVKKSLENFHLLDELGHVGHGVAHLLEHIAAEKQEADPEEVMTNLVLACVAKEMDNLTDEDLVAALNDMNEEGEEQESEPKTASRVLQRFSSRDDRDYERAHKVASLTLRVADRFAADAHPELSKLGVSELEGMFEGRPVTLYHGTTRLFRRFDLSLSRDALNDNFYGSVGVFLTPSKRIAEDYAEANRNIGFDAAIVEDLKRKNQYAGEFLETLVKHGKGGWDIFLLKHQLIEEAGQLRMEELGKLLGGVDPNTLGDIAGYVIGSNVKPLGQGDDSLAQLMGLSSTGAPRYIYDYLDEVGLNSKVYRPKVYTVTVMVSNPLLTKSKPKAGKAKKGGYDSVVYYGPGLVRGVPEVAVFDPRNVRIKKIEVL